MKKIFFSSLIVLMVLAPFNDLPGKEMKLRQVARWRHGDLGENAILTPILFSDVDSDGDLILKIGRRGAALATSKKVTFFAEIGQGPAEIPQYMTMNSLPGKKLVFLSNPGQIKVFAKINGLYDVVDSEGFFLQSTDTPMSARGIAFAGGKWFVTGCFFISDVGKMFEKGYTARHVAIFDDKGKYITRLIESTSPKFNTKYLIEHRVMTENNDVFLIIENEPVLYRISAETNALTEKIVLKTPVSYTPMPADFYTYKDYNKKGGDFMEDADHWRDSYSRVNSAALTPGQLILQIRTPGKNRRYMVLLYNRKGYVPEGEIPTDDYFLGVNGNRLYFYSGGNPGVDGDIDECNINICVIETL